MKKSLFTCLLLCCCSSIIAQKKTIDNDTYKNWNTLHHFNISNDGKYASYSSGNVLGICTTDGKFKMELTDAMDPVFTGDNRYIIFNSPDGVGIFLMGANTTRYIKDANRFATPKNDDGRWLTYHLQGNIILKDLLTEKEKTYPGATEALFNAQGTVLILKTNTILRWISLPDGNEKIIQQGIAANHISFDNTGNKLVFMINDSSGNTIRYYQSGMDSAHIHISSQSPGLRPGLIIAAHAPYFSQDGDHIFFKLSCSKQTQPTDRDSSIITDKVNIWHYKDAWLPPKQLRELSRLKYRTFTAVTSISKNKVIQLENLDTTLVANGIQQGAYVLASNMVDENEAFWNKSLVTAYYLISILDGSAKTIIPHTPAFTIPPKLSPQGKFVTWYDPELKYYCSYEIATGITRNITQAIKVSLNDEETRYIALRGFTFGSIWLTGDSVLLIYDRYDIWMVDPLGNKNPVNMTHGYGRQHNTQFRLAADEYSQSSFRATDTLLLAALNRDTKYNGIWRKPPGATSPLIPGNMEPCLYYSPRISAEYQPLPPIKAKNTSRYLVQRMSGSQASNLFTTTDFKSFTPLSDIQPQKEYNWMTTELHHWKMPDGKTAQGILYKPENFDSTKKYPIIFTYYEKRSQELYLFQTPGLSVGTLNIPWYVSNGYLVFVPDMYYTTGHTGQSVVNVVASAVKHLSAFSYVDTHKMGLQGHSFGGYETNYLISNSSLFAAAQTSAGTSDCISHYGAIGGGGKSLAFLYETGQKSLGTTPWQRPDLYIENSPIFNVDKINTPLLIMHNKEDDIVPFAQAEELFTALRRLQKPVWILQYDGEGHALGNYACRLDFTIRQQQFFDHYLKNAPVPEWMERGIPITLKGVRSGMELGNK